MAKKVQVPVLGGLRKVIQVGAATSTATTIAGLESQVVSIAQLRALLGVTQTQTPNTIGTVGGTSPSSIIVGPGLSGGGPLVGPININLTSLGASFPNEQIFDEPIQGGGGSGGGGSSTLAGLSDVAITSPAAQQALVYNGTKWANQAISSSSAGGVTVGSLTQISEQIVSTAVSSITFSNIPQNFRNLRLVVTGTANSTGAPQTQVTFNGDTGANYTTGFGYTGTGGTGSTNLNSGNSILFNSANGTTQPGYLDLVIYDYARTVFFKSMGGTWVRYDSTTAGYTGYVGGTWHNTAAITSITLTLSTNQWVAGSVFTLYGEGGSGAVPNTFVNGNVDPDFHPANPDATNDEFEGSVLSSQWSFVGQGASVQHTKQGYLYFIGDTGGTNNNTLLLQPVPGSTWKYRAKMMLEPGAAAFQLGGIAIYNSSSTKLYVYGPHQNDARACYSLTGINGSATNLFTDTTYGAYSAFIYYEVENDGTTLHFRVSQTGEDDSFVQLGSATLASFITSVTHIGLSCNNISSPKAFIVDWFRRVDTGVAPNLGTALASPNITPDTHPSSPTIYDDEFEFGTTIDTTGARGISAQAWTAFTSTTIASVVSQGALQAVTQTGSPSAGSGYAMPVPSGTWTFRWKGLRPAFEVFNLSSWKGYYFGTSGSGNSMLVQHETRNWATGSYTFGGSDASFSTNGMPAYFQLAWDGTNLVFSWSQSGYNADFTTLATVAASTFIITPDHIGFGTSAAEAVDWIRRTA